MPRGVQADAKEESQEESLEEVEEFEDQATEEEPPREIQAGVRAAQDVRRPNSPKEEKAFAMKTSGFADCSIHFEYPPHPEGEAGEKTKQVLQTLMSKFNRGTKDGEQRTHDTIC